MNNRRLLIAAVFHFMHPVGKDSKKKSNHFLGQFSVIFIEHRISNLLTKRIKLNLLYKLSYLN